MNYSLLIYLCVQLLNINKNKTTTWKTLIKNCEEVFKKV